VLAKCNACLATQSEKIEVRCKIKAKTNLVRTMHRCKACDYIFHPNNNHDVWDKPEAYFAGSDPKKFLRVGDGVRRGREYGMAKDAIEILGLEDPRILIFGAGISKDHDLLRKEGYRVYITDFINVQQSSHFISMDSEILFDIVISSEVIEHFEDPINDFIRMVKFLENDGIAISGTNMQDGSDIAKHAYIFTSGHSSYWSGKSLAAVSKRLGLEFDFRATLTKKVSPRKRYLYQSHSRRVIDKVKEYFAYRRQARSEDDYVT